MSKAEQFTIVTPQFTRPDGEPAPAPAPTTIMAWDALKTMTDAQRQHMGLRRWGRPEPHDLESRLTLRGSTRPDLTGSPMLWLFPGEWYASIPDGYEIVDISFNTEKFKYKETDNDIRFGCLAYGILVRDAS
jgi:hypothetical protein